MSSDETQAPRPGGRRQSSVPWRTVALSSAALKVAGSAALLATGHPRHALSVFSSLQSTGATASRWAQRQAAPQADEIADFGQLAQSVLYLRAFKDDRLPFSQCDARHDRHPVERQLAFLWQDPNEEFLSFERYLGPELSRRVGPLIGLGNPGDRLPPEGPVLRHYADDGDWFKKIERLIPAVRCIVMLPQVTGALNAELGVIQESGASGKFFMITSPYAAGGAGHASAPAPLRLRAGHALLRARATPWPDLVNAFKEHELTLPRSHPGPGCVIGFGGDGHAEVLTSGATRAHHYVTAIARALPPGDFVH